MISDKQLQANRANAQKSTGPKTEEGKSIVSKNATVHGLRSALPVIEGEDPAEYNDFRNEMVLELHPIGIMEVLLVDRIVYAAWRLRRIGTIEVEVYDFLRRPIEKKPNKSVAAQAARSPQLLQEYQKPAAAPRNRFASFEEAMAAWLQTQDGILYAQNKWPTAPNHPSWVDSFDKFKEPPILPNPELVEDTKNQQDAISSATPLPLGKSIADDFQNNRILIRLSRYETAIERSMFKSLRQLQVLQLEIIT